MLLKAPSYTQHDSLPLLKHHCHLPPTPCVVEEVSLYPGPQGDCWTWPAWSQWDGPKRQGSQAAVFWAQCQGQLQGEQDLAVDLQLAVVRQGRPSLAGIFKKTPAEDRAKRESAHRSVYHTQLLQLQLLDRVFICKLGELAAQLLPGIGGGLCLSSPGDTGSWPLDLCPVAKLPQRCLPPWCQ